MYHIFSLLLGVLALGLAAWGRKTPDHRFYSMTACGLSILCQLIELGRLANLEEASGIFDTAPTSALIATILFCLTLGLNCLELCRGDRNETNK